MHRITPTCTVDGTGGALELLLIHCNFVLCNGREKVGAINYDPFLC